MLRTACTRTFFFIFDFFKAMNVFMIIVRIICALSCICLFLFFLSVSFWTFEPSALQSVIRKTVAETKMAVSI